MHRYQVKVHYTGRVRVPSKLRKVKTHLWKTVCSTDDKEAALDFGSDYPISGYSSLYVIEQDERECMRSESSGRFIFIKYGWYAK